MGESASPGPVPTPPKSGDSSSLSGRAELRRHLRFKADEATAQLYVKGLLASLGIGRNTEVCSAVNLSEGGILVRTHCKIKAGSRVQVKIRFEKFNDVLECEGEVRWCYQSARDAKEFYAGVEFKDLPLAQSALIGKMRSWFTSPEYKARSATKKREASREFFP